MEHNSICVLMFSGGRDSTLAAVRLAQTWRKLILVTVTGGQLVGVERVRQHLSELGPHLPPNTAWVRVTARQEFSRFKGVTATCLGCHHIYILSGVIVADNYGSDHLALGYSGYQSNWPEQTSYALASLEKTLRLANKVAIFPVTDLRTKQQAIDELKALGLSEAALEQKCTIQQGNRLLDDTTLRDEIDGWTNALTAGIAQRHSIPIDVLRPITLDQINEVRTWFRQI